MDNRILENKTALIHGGGGAIGGAIARARPARGEGVPRRPTRAKLDAVARDVTVAGGVAETARSTRSTSRR